MNEGLASQHTACESGKFQSPVFRLKWIYWEIQGNKKGSHHGQLLHLHDRTRRERNDNKGAVFMLAC